MNLNFNITTNNINIWCARYGYKIITPLEIILEKLGMNKGTELMNKILPSEEDYTKRSARKEIAIKLLYKNEEERKDIEEKTLKLYGCIDYMLSNNLENLKAKYYDKDSSTGIIEEHIECVDIYTICYAFSRFKIIDEELIEDWFNIEEVMPEVKSLDYYNIKNTLTREIEKLWT